MNTSAADSNIHLVNKIRASHLYQSYARAFQTVTGMPLLLHPIHGSAAFVLQEGEAPQNQFCQLLNETQNCHECSRTHAGVMREAQQRVASGKCFAGFDETAIPVRSGEETVAYLRVGQVLHQQPSGGEFEALIGILVREGYDDDEIKMLRLAYMKTKVVPENDYQQIVTLLAIFSLQLSDLINQLVLAKNEAEPPMIAKAKKHIGENLDERLSLKDVADIVGVSSYYFCKVFKQITGMTFTEYVNRKRVQCAKQALLKPHLAVTEVAFAVGYQSLSQFNRCFLKYAGESPTHYRKRMIGAAKDEAGLLAS